ncbi:MAG: MFS transporter [Candidatus Sericytochromatia bacterium]
MNKNLEANLKYYYIFSAFCFTPFSIPIITLFWQSNGLTLSDIYLLEAIFSIIVVLIDIPTGMVADRLGKQLAMKLATFMMILGWVTYAIGHSFLAFLIAEVFLAFGQAFISGADASLLFETLKKLGREDEFKKHEGKAKSLQMYCFAICNIIGGFVGSYDMRATVFMSCLGPFLALIISTKLIEVNKIDKTESLSEHWSSYKNLLKSSFKFVLKHKLIQWNIIYFSILTGSSVWLLWLYQPYMEFIGLPVWFFGIAFATFNFFAAFISGISHRIIRKYGLNNTYLILGFLQLIPLILMSVVLTKISFLFILGHQAVRALGRPLIVGEILKYTYSDKRATIISFGSLFSRLFFSITAPFIMYVADKGVLENLATQATMLTIFLAFMYFSYKKIPEKYFQVKDTVLQKT